MAAGLMLAFGASSASAQNGLGSLPGQEPGYGTLCIWSMLTVVAEVGSRCHAGENLALQANLDRAAARFKEYVIINMDPPLTDGQVQEFLRVFGYVGAPVEQVCSELFEDVYQRIASDPEFLTDVDALIAEPGKPTMGLCY